MKVIFKIYAFIFFLTATSCYGQKMVQNKSEVKNLEINKDRFVKENATLINQDLFKPINYNKYKFLRHSNQPNISLVEIENIGEGVYLKTQFRKENLDFLYFTKNDEWESESEMRLLVFSGKKEKEYCSIEDSLETIYLGVDFHDSYVPSIKKIAKNKNILKMSFLHEGLVCTKLS